MEIINRRQKSYHSISEPAQGKYEPKRRKQHFSSRPVSYLIVGVVIVSSLLVGYFALFREKDAGNAAMLELFHGYRPLAAEHKTSLVLTEVPDHNEELPTRWLWTDVDGVDYTTPSHNQHQPNQYCGACWVFGSLAIIDDRLKLQNPNGWTFQAAHQALINCGPHYEAGCNGGDANEAYRWIHENGIPDTGCINYQAKNMPCDELGLCQDCMPMWGQPSGQCAGKPEGTYPIAIVEQYSNISMVPEDQRNLRMIKQQVRRMKAEIRARGPIACAVNALPLIKYMPYHPWEENSLPYEPYVFTYDKVGNDCKEGDGFPQDCLDHQIEVVGWDFDKNGIEYWLVRNSWGTWWGENGWFRVEVGKNVLGIESDCEWVVPKLLDDFVEIQEFLATKHLRKALHAKTVAEAERLREFRDRRTSKLVE